MPEQGVVGTFGTAPEAARAIRALHEDGVADVRAAMPAPFPEVVEALGRPRSRLGLATFPGALLGLLLGIGLTVGTSVAWPLVTGGKPIVSIPPFVVVIFEVTVLVGALTNLAAVLVGAARGRRFPRVARAAGDRIGVFAAGGGERAERILREGGAEEVRRVGLALLACVALAGAACSNDWRTDMWYQPSVRPEDAPRPEPERSVPLGAGPVYVDRDDTADLRDPVAPTASSLAHGRMLFAARCTPCHGPEGHGGGPVSRLFPPAPDLAYVTVRQRTDGFIWGTITYGGKAMPPQREGLSATDRWDLVNVVRAIQGRGPPP